MIDLTELLTKREELTAALAAVDAEIAQARSAERNEAITKIRQLMAQYGLTASDLGGAPKAAVPAKGPKSGSKVAPKYRNAATGETWSGRGLKPKWLATALESGAKIEDFLI